MEINILLWIQENIVSSVLNEFFVFYTSLGEMGILWIIIIIGLLLFKKTRLLGVLCAISLLTEYILNDYILKNLIARPRPYTEYPMDLLIPIPNSFSMPSGHAASSFSVAMVFFFRKEKGTLLMLLLASLMAFSRLYLFVHYPSDIIAGIALGSLVAFTIVHLERKTNFLKQIR